MNFWRRQSDILRITELTAERDGLVAEKNALTAERDGLAAEKEALTAERDGLLSENDKLRTSLRGLENLTNELRQRLPSDADFCMCNVCGCKSEFRFRGRLLNKYDIRYYLCPTCGHVQTEKPYWLDEAYGFAISVSDTGVVLRNEQARDVVKAIVATFFDSSAKVLEYAGGYGLLTRMLRDAGVDCRWYDKYAKPVFAVGFEDDGKRTYDIVTAFEALEHFEEPLDELKRIFARAHTLIFSEELLPDPVPAPADWWYYCLEHGQHINLYSRKTLEHLAARFDKRLVYHGSIGMMTDREVDEAAFAKCVEDCRAIAEAWKWPTLSVSDMNLMIDEMAEKK